jgi:hypothetical protein
MRASFPAESVARSESVLIPSSRIESSVKLAPLITAARPLRSSTSVAGSLSVPVTAGFCAIFVPFAGVMLTSEGGVRSIVKCSTRSSE